ncbi:MAG: SRPBCC domain-containing protein [Trueperaceae bacterium]
MAKVSEYVPNTSAEAVHSATGKDWTEWFRLLDEAGAAQMGHKEIVSWLRDEAQLANAWWQQTVTVEYEKARGKRALVGQTADAGFQVGAQRTIDSPAERVWEWLTTAPGRDVWLGKVDELPLEKGRRYETVSGTSGEIRAIRPNQRVRLTWQPNGWPRPSTMQVSVTPKEGRCTVGFHHEKLPDANARQAMRAHWTEVLDQLQKAMR